MQTNIVAGEGYSIIQLIGKHISHLGSRQIQFFTDCRNQTCDQSCLTSFFTTHDDHVTGF